MGRRVFGATVVDPLAHWVESGAEGAALKSAPAHGGPTSTVAELPAGVGESAIAATVLLGSYLSPPHASEASPHAPRCRSTGSRALEVLRRREPLRPALDDEGGDTTLLRDIRVRPGEQDAEPADARSGQ